MWKTIIICEKPSAAAKIAAALGEKVSRREMNRVPYYMFEHANKEIIVVSALGHLFTLKNKKPMKDYPIYDLDWVPTHVVEKKAQTKVFIETIETLANNADEFISACDFDVEGSVIAYNVIRYICGDGAVKKARRMKFSTLTVAELKNAYENLMPKLDFEIIDAGIARHVLDWYWGMNVSKALSAAVEASDQKFAKLSAGRVQTPTLKILVDREKEIAAFKPEPFWTLDLLLDIDGTEVTAEHKTEKFFDKAAADEALAACKGKPAKIVSIEPKKYQRQPPFPFDLGTLQAEAYRCFGYSPLRTQQIAQDLYQAALISYPRTSSQKLPPSIDYKGIISNLGKISPQYQKISKEILAQPALTPNEGKKTDPAHPAIFPTGEMPEKMPSTHNKLYDLIVRRFFSVFGKPATVESQNVGLDVGGQPFHIHGRRLIEKGWISHYALYTGTEEVLLPPLKEGQKLKVKETLFEEKETQPPARYNPASLVKELESRNLGTKSTRAPTIGTLQLRGYILGNQITVTELGMQIIDTLAKYCPEILSEDLTAHFESDMDSILDGKIRKEDVISEAREELDKILQKFKSNQVEIGKQIFEAVRTTRAKQWILGKCSKCGGEIRMIISKKTHKRFAGCSNYPNCKNSFPLPQMGMIVSLNTICKECGEPMIQVNRTGKRPYRMCIKPDCPSKADWGKKNASD